MSGWIYERIANWSNKTNIMNEWQNERMTKWMDEKMGERMTKWMNDKNGWRANLTNDKKIKWQNEYYDKLMTKLTTFEKTKLTND